MIFILKVKTIQAERKSLLEKVTTSQPLGVGLPQKLKR